MTRKDPDWPGICQMTVTIDLEKGSYDSPGPTHMPTGPGSSFHNCQLHQKPQAAQGAKEGHWSSIVTNVFDQPHLRV